MTGVNQFAPTPAGLLALVAADALIGVLLSLPRQMKLQARRLSVLVVLWVCVCVIERFFVRSDTEKVGMKR